jgi:hypothetical protein
MKPINRLRCYELIVSNYARLIFMTKPLSFVPLSFLARDYTVFKESSNTSIKPEKMRSFSFSAPCIG